MFGIEYVITDPLQWEQTRFIYALGWGKSNDVIEILSDLDDAVKSWILSREASLHHSDPAVRDLHKLLDLEYGAYVNRRLQRCKTFATHISAF